MAIQSSALGPHSTVISYDAGTAAADLRDAIVAAADGWTVHDDTVGDGSVVLRAPNVDGMSRKVTQLSVSDADGRAYLMAYESWDAGAHSGTNLSRDSDAFGALIDLANGGEMRVYADTRWLGLLGTVGTAHGDGYVGVHERSRDNALDVAGSGPDLPPVIWAATSQISTGGYGNKLTSPRTLDRTPGRIVVSAGGAATFTYGSGAGTLTYPVSPDLWTGENMVMPAIVYSADASDGNAAGALLGVVMGLIWLEAGLGTYGTEVTVRADGDFVPDPSGADVTFVEIGTGGDYTDFPTAVPL